MQFRAVGPGHHQHNNQLHFEEEICRLLHKNRDRLCQAAQRAVWVSSYRAVLEKGEPAVPGPIVHSHPGRPQLWQAWQVAALKVVVKMEKLDILKISRIQGDEADVFLEPLRFSGSSQTKLAIF